MQDRHEVVLEANITKFKNQIKEATVVSENFNKTLQKSRHFVHSEWANGIYGVREAIKSGSEEIYKQNRLYAKQLEILSHIKKLQTNKSAIATSGRLYKNGGYSGSTAIFKETSEGMKELSNNAKSVEINTKGMEKAFGKSLKSIKRLTIGFLGARSAFMLFRRYMSEYSRENEDFAQKMQLTTSIVANALGPVFEWFGNILQYAIIGLARIIELLTGINILSTAMDKGFKNAGKSAKSFVDNFSDLDEISNIQEDSGGLSTGIGGQLKALEDFQKKIKEVDEWLEKSGIKKFLTDLQPIIRDVFGWIGDHPIGALGIIGGFTILKGLLPTLLGVPGGATGLFGVATVLTIIAAINIKEIVDQWEKLMQHTSANEKEAESLITKWGVLESKEEEFVSRLTSEEVQKQFNTLNKQANGTLDSMLSKLKDLEKYKHFPHKTDPNKKTDLKMLEGYVAELSNYLEFEEQAFKQGKLSEEQEVKYREKLDESREAMKKLIAEGYDYHTELGQIERRIREFDTLNPVATVTINADTQEAETKIDNLETRIAKLIADQTAGVITGTLNLFKLPFKAEGGLISEGQMFVAREAGPELVGTVGGHSAVMNNDQIVQSVSAGVYQAVVSAMGGQSDRPIVLEINGKEFAKATYSDFQDEGSRRGTNTALRRN